MSCGRMRSDRGGDIRSWRRCHRCPWISKHPPSEHVLLLLAALHSRQPPSGSHCLPRQESPRRFHLRYRKVYHWMYSEMNEWNATILSMVKSMFEIWGGEIYDWIHREIKLLQNECIYYWYSCIYTFYYYHQYFYNALYTHI